MGGSLPAEGSAGRPGGPWDDGPVRPRLPSLVEDVEADLVVIGAGICGLTTAVLAAERGLDVRVLEARELGSGTSSRITGRLTTQHGGSYERARRQRGTAWARSSAMAARGGIDLVDRLVATYGIECGLERVPFHLAVTTPALVPALEAESQAAYDAGLRPVPGWYRSEPLVDAEAVITFCDERQLHPLAYLAGLARGLQRLGGNLHEGSRVTEIEPSRNRSGRWVVRTPAGQVSATHVVVAAPLPRSRWRRSASPSSAGVTAITARSPEGPLPPASVSVVGDGTWSVRTSRWPGDDELLVVGPDRPPGDPHRSHDEVIRWTRERWPDAEITQRWHAQEKDTIEEPPQLGWVGDRSIWIATQRGRWGLARGTYAAQSIVRGIAREPAPVAGFLTGRSQPIRRLKHLTPRPEAGDRAPASKELT